MVRRWLRLLKSCLIPSTFLLPVRLMMDKGTRREKTLPVLERYFLSRAETMADCGSQTSCAGLTGNLLETQTVRPTESSEMKNAGMESRNAYFNTPSRLLLQFENLHGGSLKPRGPGLRISRKPGQVPGTARQRKCFRLYT